MKRVVKSDLIEAGNSIFPPYRRPGWMWELTLECGHQIYRNVRYVGQRTTRHCRTRPAEEVAPAPRKIICDKCERHLLRRQFWRC